MLRKQPIGTVRSQSKTWRAVLLTVLASAGFAVSGLRGPLRDARADNATTVPDNTKSSVKVEDQAANGGSPPTFDRSYLPENAIAVISLKPLKVDESKTLFEPVLSSFPFAANVSFAFSTAGNGVDEVKTIVLSAPAEAAPSTSQESTEPAALEIYRMRKPYEPGKLRITIFGEAPDGVTETTCLGYPCFQARSDVSGHLVNYLLVDERTLVVLGDRDVPRVLAAGSQSHPSWYDEWTKIADSPLAIACDSAAMAAIETNAADAQDPQEMFILAMLRETALIFAQVECSSGGLKVSATARCESPEKALATTNVLQGGATSLIAALTTVPQIFEKSSMPKEFQSLDVTSDLVRALSDLKMSRQEQQVQAEIKFGAAFVVAVADATKALVARQSEELKAREKDNDEAHVAKLGKLAAAFNAYQAEHGHYPPSAVIGPDGKTLHSWRVELLPYLGERELFEAYKLDERWDSEHNKPLIKKIPGIYSTSVWTQKGDADYFVVTGKGTLFDADAAVGRESATDAPGETILVLQSHQRIPWTKPADIETSDGQEPVCPFRGHGKGFYAAFADGTVKLVSKDTDAASVRAMFTKAGGDEVKLR